MYPKTENVSKYCWKCTKDGSSEIFQNIANASNKESIVTQQMYQNTANAPIFLNTVPKYSYLTKKSIKSLKIYLKQKIQKMYPNTGNVLVGKLLCHKSCAAVKNNCMCLKPCLHDNARCACGTVAKSAV